MRAGLRATSNASPGSGSTFTEGDAGGAAGAVFTEEDASIAGFGAVGAAAVDVSVVPAGARSFESLKAVGVAGGEVVSRKAAVLEGVTAVAAGVVAVAAAAARAIAA